MLGTQQSIVNQRIYFCRLHLDWFEEQLQQQHIPKQIIAQALGESVVFHLVMAYKAYLIEIAQSCSLNDIVVDNALQLARILEDQQNYLSDLVKEAVALESSESWLSALLSRYQQRGLIGSEITTSSHRSVPVIPLQPIDSVLEPLTLDQATDFYQSLQQLIEVQRLHLVQW